VRSQELGYPVRGVVPSAFDVWLGATLGEAAVRCLVEGRSDVMVGWTQERGVCETPFQEVVGASNRPPAEKWSARPGWQRLLDLQRKLARPPGSSV
jgi:6-phosphofructokinase